jgi:hypothetical protein
MADAGIRKLIIPKNQLPPVTDDNKYILRYRIVSDDKNRVSHYSTIFLATGNNIEPVDGNISINGNSLVAVWGDENNRPKYDIFVKFDNGTYEYHGTSPIHTYGFLKDGTINVRVAVQVEGISKTRNAELTIFESNLVSLV